MRSQSFAFIASVIAGILFTAGIANAADVSAADETAADSSVADESGDASATESGGTKSSEPRSETGPTLYLGSGFAVAGEQDTSVHDPTAPAANPPLDGPDFDFKYQEAALAEIGLGYRVARHVRIEANVDYRQHTLENVKYRPGRGDVHLIAGMANVYADYPLGSQLVGLNEIPIFIPYVGAGVGVLWSKPKAELQFPNRKVRGESAEFAWNLMFGTEIPITRWVALNVGYRYLESLDHRWLLRSGTSGVGDVDSAYRSHEGRVGLRIGY